MTRLLLVLGCVLSLTGMGGAQSPTQFPGTTAVGQTSASVAVTLTYSRAGVPARVGTFTQGSAGLEFQLAANGCTPSGMVAAGQTCVVQVTFHPATPGERIGGVAILDATNEVLAEDTLVGQGAGGLAVFVPAVLATVAGNSSTFLYAGDGGQATNASLFLPYGIALDGAGDLYIADTQNNRVRRVDASTGIIHTIAGNGSSGYAGDGGPALSAELNRPTFVALDLVGNVYISDSGNNVVRMLNTSTGIITTIAGTGAVGHSGDGGAATAARLQNPNGLAFDLSGNLFIADTGNNLVRVVTASTGVISTFAGDGYATYAGDNGPAAQASLHGPWGLSFSSAGELYIADQGNNAIRKVSTTGTISTVSGSPGSGFSGDGGPASAAKLTSPAYALLDAAGDLYISDSGNGRIRKVSATTGTITTIAGGGIYGDGLPATMESLYGTYTLALDKAGNLDVADTIHNRVRKVVNNMAQLDFTPQRVNSQSPTQVQQVENDGTAALTVSALTAVSNAVVDPASTCTAGAVVAPLAQCNIVAAFLPTTTGTPVFGSIELDSDAANANSTLQLRGLVQSTYPSTVLLSASPNPAIVGQPVTFFAQVVSSGGLVATGTVTLLDGSNTLQTVPLVNGSASITISNLAVGQHTMTASYGGDSNNAAAVSSAVVEVIEVAPANASTTTNLSSSANPSGFGSPLILTATVAAATASQASPTGTVTFLDGTTVLGTATLTAGTARISTSTLSVGTHQLTAAYGGSGSSLVSTSDALPEVIVNGPTPTTSSFQFTVTPSTVSLQSGARTTLQISLTATTDFSGAVLFGCGGLPAQATCTFSATQVTVAAGGTQALSVVLDTGNPLGAGPTARLAKPWRPGSGVVLALLPGGVLLVLVRRRRPGIRLLRLACALVVAGAMGAMAGCGSTYNVSKTPAGTYAFQIVGSSAATSATATVPVNLTVTP